MIRGAPYGAIDRLWICGKVGTTLVDKSVENKQPFSTLLPTSFVTQPTFPQLHSRDDYF